MNEIDTQTLEGIIMTEHAAVELPICRAGTSASHVLAATASGDFGSVT